MRGGLLRSTQLGRVRSAQVPALRSSGRLVRWSSGTGPSGQRLPPIASSAGTPRTGADAGDGRLRGAGRHGPDQVLGRSPAECAVADQEEEGDEHHDGEDHHFDEAEGAQLMEDHRPRVQEHDLDVEDDEDHGHQVEADRETGGRLDGGDDPALVGSRLGRRGPLRRGHEGRGYERQGGEEEAEDEEDQNWQVIVHRDLFLPRPPSSGHIGRSRGSLRQTGPVGEVRPGPAARSIGGREPRLRPRSRRHPDQGDRVRPRRSGQRPGTGVMSTTS